MKRSIAYVIILAAFLIPNAQAGETETVILKFDAPAKSEDTIAIAKSFQPQNFLVTANSTILDSAITLCGNPSLTYLAVLADQNKLSFSQLNTNLVSDQDVEFPVCIRALVPFESKVVGNGDTITGLGSEVYDEKFGEKVVLFAKDNKRKKSVQETYSSFFNIAESILESNRGGDCQGTMNTCESVLTGNSWQKLDTDFKAQITANLMSRENGITNFDDINVGAEIQFPLSLSTNLIGDGRLYAMNIQKSDNINPVILGQILDTTGVAFSGASVVGRANSGILEPLAANIQSNCGVYVQNSSEWPFNLRSLGQSFYLNENVINDAITSKILIMDSGLDFGFLDPVLSRYLAPLKNVEIRGAVEATFSGVNLADMKNSSKTADEYQNRWHGLEVLGAATGSNQIRTTNFTRGLPIKISVASLISLNSGKADIQAFLRSKKIIKKNEIDVVNISYFTSEQIDPMLDVIEQVVGQTLFVIAAGNDSEEMKEDPIFPAAYGGIGALNSSGNLISVGAHNDKGELADFSRYDDKMIDLLAPGCNIETVTVVDSVDGKSVHTEDVVRSGTSFAAPLVSYVAAMLKSISDASPKQLKARLNSSVDVDKLLEGKVFSRGILNLKKTISFQNDITIFKQGGREQFVYSDVKNRRDDLYIDCEGNQFLFEDISKISIVRDDNGNKYLHYLIRPLATRNSSWPLVRGPLCEIENFKQFVPIKLAQFGGRINEISMKQLEDFIPKMKFWERNY